MVRSVPRSALKAGLKKRLGGLRLDGSVDLLIYLNCVLFLKRLATEARLKAIEDKCSIIKPAHIRAVAQIVLKKLRG